MLACQPLPALVHNSLWLSKKLSEGQRDFPPMTTLFSAAVGYSELNLHSTQRSQKHFTHSIYTIAVRQPSID